MNALKVICIVFIILLPSVSAAAGDIPDGNIPAIGNIYSRFGHYNLLNVPERQGMIYQREIGGAVTAAGLGAVGLRWRYSSGRFEYREHEPDRVDFTLTGRSRIGGMGCRIPLFDSRLIFDHEISVNSQGQKATVATANTIHASPLTWMTFRFYLNKAANDYLLTGTFWGEDIRSTFATDRVQTGARVRVEVFDDISLIGGYDDLTFDNPPVSKDLQYSSLITGDANHRFHGIEVGDRQRGYIRLMIDRYQGAGQFDLFTYGTRFGQIAQTTISVSHWQVTGRPSFIGSNHTFSLERFSGKLDAAGNIQGWPFTESLADLLGLRRNFSGTVDAALWHLQAVDRFAISKTLSLIVHSDLFRLYPDIRFADWMPTFMVFGVTDLDRYSDNYERVDFGQIKIDLSGSIGVVSWGGSVSQLFPLIVKKDHIPAEASTGGEPGDIIHSSSTAKPSSDGGRQISVWLGVRF